MTKPPSGRPKRGRTSPLYVCGVCFLSTASDLEPARCRSCGAAYCGAEDAPILVVEDPAPGPGRPLVVQFRGAWTAHARALANIILEARLRSIAEALSAPARPEPSAPTTSAPSFRLRVDRRRSWWLGEFVCGRCFCHRSAEAKPARCPACGAPFAGPDAAPLAWAPVGPSARTYDTPSSRARLEGWWPMAARTRAFALLIEGTRSVRTQASQRPRGSPESPRIA